MEEKVMQFDSLTAMIEAHADLPRVSGRSEREIATASKHGWNDGMCRGLTKAEARVLAINGWPEGAKAAAERAETIASRVVKTAHDADQMALVPDVAGAAFDVGAIVAGVPEAWIRPQPTPTRKGVNIIVDPGSSGMIGDDKLMQRGIAVIALALVLQANGYAVTMDIHNTHSLRYGGPSSHAIKTRVADGNSGSPLDVDRLAFVLANSAYARYFEMDLTYETPGFLPTGTYLTYPATVPNVPSDTLYVPSLKSWEPHWENPDAWVLQQFNKLTEEVV